MTSAMVADVFTLDTTYRLQIRADDGWSDYSQCEYVSADAAHQLAAEIYGGLQPQDYRLIEIRRTVIGNSA